MEPKPWWASKLIWTGSIEVAFGIWELAKDGQITDADFQAILLIVAGFATIVFRAFTARGLANRAF